MDRLARTTPLLVLHRISKSFSAGVPGCSARVLVLRGASLALGPGEVTLLAGPPGSGKTTLLLCAAGLIRPDGGTVTRRSVSYPGGGDFSAAYVPGAPVFARYLRVADAVALYTRPGAGHAAAAAARFLELGEPRRRRVDSLSRTELYRLSVACALGAGSPLLLLDDAPPAVRPAEDPLLLRLVHRLARAGTSVVISSCDAAAPAGQSRTVVLENGATRTERQAHPGPRHPRLDQEALRSACRSGSAPAGALVAEP